MRPAMPVHSRADIVRRYLHALDAGDTREIVKLFAPEGEVISPFLGRMGAAAFFAKLAESSQNSEITPIDVFASLTEPRVAAYFRYRWTLKDGSVITFDCCDIFDFAPQPEDDVTLPRIARMTIIYDTAPIRDEVGDKYA
ncbi:nuclear transport factor 2 family protein [Nonomuraea sp. NPDC059194]|uniref:nuclear transport factor 2 family protein n=1 Tax=Nonomuraea sp. NPDC059194 TaxID=3346764 RepID=UPI0036810659